MQLIECPYCGPREETEFHYGGQAHVAYPDDPYALTDHEKRLFNLWVTLGAQYK